MILYQLKKLFKHSYLFLLISCEGQTPEEFNQNFQTKFNDCVERAKNRCDNLDESECLVFAETRCETFLGTSENPIVK
ncbi:MAG: hypothetical protein HOH08_03350 [Gammaproteobacteria bacterium]|jgi:hypothetical protein|nr:hypothetical protein [Gammaproteobacteria bacterium]MBT6073967.1 hypothetical protein [Gammaproteobacteria bacterium]MDG2434226.1 hypothetical protein [Gammaproteobacteria bacterium]